MASGSDSSDDIGEKYTCDDDDDCDDDEDDNDGDLSNLAAVTKIESFSVKRKCFEVTERGPKRLAQTIFGSVRASSGAVMPVSGLQESEDIPKSETDKRTTETATVAENVPGLSQTSRELVPSLQASGVTCELDVGGNTKVIQQNFIQVEQKFGDVTVQGTRNLTIGGTQNIGQPGPPQQEEKQSTWAEKIRNRTLSRIGEWTESMVKTSALNKVMDKLDSGVSWITIRGSPGEGKTTVAFMALEELHRSGRQVFQVISPEEFCEVTVACSQPVIMLDDTFGNLEFDQAEWSRWKPALQQVLGGKEHTSHVKRETTRSEKEVTVILVGRDYVLKSASFNMGRMADYFANDGYVVDMSDTAQRNLQEKQDIWNVISASGGIKLHHDTVDRICRIKVPHGFPHVCRLFVTLRQTNTEISAESFFKAPLEFLNQTIKTFMRDKSKLTLFKEIIKREGKLSVRELDSFESCDETIDTAEDLVGTYLRKEDGGFAFDHPSIYDSVALNLCKRYPLFVIENCSLSFIHERLRLEQSRGTGADSPNSESGLVVHIPPSCVKDLAKRFAAEISKNNLMYVLSHKAFTNELFVKEVMSCITSPMDQLLKQTDTKTSEDFLSLIGSSKSPQLLKYIDSHPDIHLTDSDINRLLYGVCKYAASNVLTFLFQTRPTLDINVRYGRMNLHPLMIAAETRDGQFVQQIMSLNPDLEACNVNGTTVLHYLCENGLVSAVDQMLDKGVDVNATTLLGFRPLYYACQSNQKDLVRLLLDRGAVVDAWSLERACSSGQIDAVTLMFEKGATVSMATELYSPLTSACRGGHTKMIKFLVAEGASINQADGSGEHPLHAACHQEQVQALKCLLEAGADINIINNHGETALFVSAESGSKECVEVLLQVGANVKIQNEDGKTAFHAAAGNGNKECVDLLMEAGADMNVRNTDGETVLATAARWGYKECVDVLLKTGADVKTLDRRGRTPLHTAVCNTSFFCWNHLPDLSVCETLISHGAGVNKQDEEGNTPLHLLCQLDSDTSIHVSSRRFKHASCFEDLYRKLVTLLVKHGADVNIHNSKGEPALRGWCQTLSY